MRMLVRQCYKKDESRSYWECILADVQTNHDERFKMYYKRNQAQETSTDFPNIAAGLLSNAWFLRLKPISCSFSFRLCYRPLYWRFFLHI